MARLIRHQLSAEGVAAVARLMTRSATLPAAQGQQLNTLLACCAPMATLAARIREFAAILTERRGTDLNAWIDRVQHDDLPVPHAFCHGLDRDLPTVQAGRAGFPLSRHRILLS